MSDQLSKPPVTPQQRNPLLTAMTIVAALAVGLGSLWLMPLTGLIGPVLVFGGLLFFGLMGFHYFVWGRWLTRILQEQANEEQDSD